MVLANTKMPFSNIIDEIICPINGFDIKTTYQSLPILITSNYM